MSRPPRAGLLRRPAARGAAAALLAAAAAAGLLALAGCTTIHPATTAASKTAAGWLGVLPADGSLYLSLDLETARPALEGFLLQAGAGEKSARSLLGRTRRVYAAVQLAAPAPSPARPPSPALAAETGAGAAPAPAAGLEFSAIALGRFSRDATNLSLSWSGDWKGERSPEGLRWFRHRRQRLQIALPGENLVLLSSSAVLPMARAVDGARPLDLPPEAALAMERASFALYLPALPAAAGEALGDRLPIRDALVSGRPLGKGFDSTVVLGLSRVRNPRVVELLFRTLLTVWLRGARLENLPERLKAVRVTADPESLRITGLVLTPEEMARLLRSFPTGAAPAAAPPAAGPPPAAPGLPGGADG